MITKFVPEKRYRIKMLKNTMFGDSVLLRKGATLVISSYLAPPSGNSPFPVRKWAAKIGKTSSSSRGKKTDPCSSSPEKQNDNPD